MITTRFRTLSCSSCSHVFHYLGDRLPSFCPECGTSKFFLESGYEVYQDNVVNIIGMTDEVNDIEPSGRRIKG